MQRKVYYLASLTTSYNNAYEAGRHTIYSNKQYHTKEAVLQQVKLYNKTDEDSFGVGERHFFYYFVSDIVEVDPADAIVSEIYNHALRPTTASLTGAEVKAAIHQLVNEGVISYS